MPEANNGVRRARAIVVIAATGLTALVTLLGAVCGATWSAAADRTAIQRDTQRACHELAQHDERLRSLEEHYREIATDLRWIRAMLERKATE